MCQYYWKSGLVDAWPAPCPLAVLERWMASSSSTWPVLMTLAQGMVAFLLKLSPNVKK